MNDRDVFAKIRRLFALEGEEHGYSDAELAPLLAETGQLPAVCCMGTIEHLANIPG